MWTAGPSWLPTSSRAKRIELARLCSRGVWHQHHIDLRRRERGIHLVTDEIVQALPELAELRVGLLHLHLLHTSAGLALNENASPDVRRDLETWLDRASPRAPDTGGTRSRAPTTCRPT